MQSKNGIVTIESRQPVDPTVQKILNLLQASGTKLFNVIDQSAEAQGVGLQMRPTKLVIFGNPKAGTPLMVSSPTIALDLPLKLLVWEDEKGKVWISYNAPSYLQARHNLRADLVQNITAIEKLAANAAQ
jgi:uncharacterized protein (DUF302 family)